MGSARIMTEQPYNLGRAAALAAAVLLAAAVPLGTVWTLGLHRKQAALEAQAEPAAPEPAAPEPAAGAAGYVRTCAPRSSDAGSTAPASGSSASDLEQQLKRLERTIVFDWIGVGAAAAGAVLMAVALSVRSDECGVMSEKRGAAGRATHHSSLITHHLMVAAAAAPAACAVLCAAPEAVSQESVPMARLAVLVAAAVAWLVVARPLPGRLQYGVCVACLAVAALFFTWWEPPPPKAVPIARPLALLEKELMAKLPGWTGQDRRMPKAIEGQVGADEYLNLDLTPPAGARSVTVYITYNANAMSQIPHVPWVCMTQAGYKLVEIRQDGMAIAGVAGREIQPNVILFEGGSGRERARALMFQYFRVGETYTWSRQLARFLATTGSLGGAGSFLSQTQVAVWLAPDDTRDPLDKNSPAYRLGLQVLDLLVPLLERGYYPDLRGPEGG
ncbi:MAG: hypothetical protein IMZ44_05805 [Planctomycetes bacterium]|nr:hypothetical protein [Planctomycetota bacterium]